MSEDVPNTQGVYRQCKEVQRVLSVKYDVTLEVFKEFPATIHANSGALYILIAAHNIGELPPHYIIYQTEQWGHERLQPYKAVWGNQSGNSSSQTTLEAF